MRCNCFIVLVRVLGEAGSDVQTDAAGLFRWNFEVKLAQLYN